MGFHSNARVAASLVVVSALFLASASAVAALPRKLSQDDLISKLCSKTDYVTLCISSVKKNIKGQHTGVSVLNAEIDAAANSTKEALAKATTLYKSASSKVEKEILGTCQEMYGDAIDEAVDAKAAIKAHDSASLNSYLSALLTDVETCEDTYSDFSRASPLKELDDLIRNLGSNCFKIASQIGL
ncbi:hypothetical protein MLD38_028142 [Melastoma candidum]|uniref:Uncharacterized protein n=1 Tax=Melastoma candidum TaxID=119954 RepID=A0ACB9N0P7_9MYRT|nr:hypothetical protein MLD38_028142 [Melastoma candidum]